MVIGGSAYQITKFVRKLVSLPLLFLSHLAFSAGPNCHQAYCFLQGTDCPTVGKSLNWYEYLNKKYTNPAGYPRYGVEFRYARAINDPQAMENRDRGMCYGGGYLRLPYGGTGAGFTSSRNPNYSTGQHDVSYYHNYWALPGDPSKYQVNIDGAIFIFNSAGEVFDHKGRAVGQMVCYIANDCLKYQ